MKIPRALLVSMLIALSTAAAPGAAGKTPSIVPQPQSIEMLAGQSFTLTGGTQLLYGDQKAKAPAEMLAAMLRPSSGFDLAVKSGAKADKNAILLTTVGADAKLGSEGYELTVGSGGVVIKSPGAAGLFYGAQTVRQLLPVEIFSSKRSSAVWVIPGVKISDKPSFAWRGIMLDVSRWFFDKEFVKRYLDMMAMHKLNVLHWHLIDDPGWRIEIKKYPKLTKIGAFRGEGKWRFGGFYTQDDIREIVKYAADRHIEIVPEVELPAHTLSAIVAYPHLCCTGKQMTIPTRHAISRDLYCAGRDTTWTFLEDVMTEVCELFPGKFVHIGGDEARYDRWKACPHCQKKIKELGLKSEKELQGWMTRRIEKFLQTKGKQILGWDEILSCGISNSAGVMTWHRPKTASVGAKRGHPVVMALTGHCYFDAPESKLPGEPYAASWIAPISLKKAYQWNPVPAGLTGAAASNILGAQGCVWSDQLLIRARLTNEKSRMLKQPEKYIEYLTLPRAAALAEVTWTPGDQRDWDKFSTRMGRMLLRYSQSGYNYRVPVPIITAKKQADGSALISAAVPIEGGTVRYTIDNSTPTADSPKLTEPVATPKSSAFKAVTIGSDGRSSLVMEYVDQSVKYAKYGKKIGQWKSGKIASRKAAKAVFDATGLINKPGLYTVTFLYTGGRQRLDIDSIEVVKNDKEVVAKDTHHGFTGGKSKGNTYRVKIDDYETGASYKINAMIYGDVGADSNGLVFIRPGK
ncbi:MAG: family 20 glycosylhydrolase [Phycisphaerae bacterium]|jgi:hexosaminidase|nr:family 20 glycosylhydrolase [Phycisphaerae bacterium]